MIALLLTIGFLVMAAGVIGKLAGSTTTGTMIGALVFGALIAISTLFFL